MSTRQYKEQAYERYNDAVAWVEEDYAFGEITGVQRYRYLGDLYNALMSDLSDEGE